MSKDLVNAAAHGEIGTVRQLLNSDAVDINARDERYGMTAIICAAAGNHSDIVSLLIDHGAELNTRDNESDGGFTG